MPFPIGLFIERAETGELVVFDTLADPQSARIYRTPAGVVARVKAVLRQAVRDERAGITDRNPHHPRSQNPPGKRHWTA